jgi:hypothetical protein
MDVTTRRLLCDPKVAHTFQGGLVLAAVGQLLVRPDAVAGAVEERLNEVAERVTSVLDDVPDADQRLAHLDDDRRSLVDVSLGRLREHSDDPDAQLVETIRELRALRLPDGRPPAIGANTLLVPCPRVHACSATTPEATDDTVEIPPQDPNAAVDVTVIDTGYIPHDALAGRTIDAFQGEYVPDGATSFAPVPADEVDRDGDGMLDFLAGHGTFSIGVIAARCAAARITSIGHRSHYAYSTEIELVRTLIGIAGRPQVISMEFAAPTLDYALPVGFAVAAMAQHPDSVLVAAAGNADATSPWYPAACGDVLGVGAIDESGRRASFSNHGPWVRCCALGTDVLSTHVTFDGPSEDEPDASGPYTGWSRWSGTSFSTPKVAAAIAQEAAASGDPPRLAAWRLLNGQTGVPVAWRPDMGMQLTLP